MPEVLQGRSYSGQMLAMAANVVVVVCAGGGAREACEACEAGVSYCCAMVSISLGGSGTAKRAYGCALRCQPVGGVPGLSECRVLVAGSSGLGGLVSVGRSLDWESRKRIPGDVKGCRRAKTKARPGWP